MSENRENQQTARLMLGSGQISLPSNVPQTPPQLPSIGSSSMYKSGNFPRVDRSRSLTQWRPSPAQLPNVPSDLHFNQDPNDSEAVREQCRRLCLSLFFREYDPVVSLGFTSAIHGEGRSLLAMTAAEALSRDSTYPVVLLECDWDNPGFHKLFGFPPTPGLAELLRGECNEGAIRYQVNRNLTVIPAGDSRQDAVRLLHYIRQVNLLHVIRHANELFIVDLPAVVPTAYGALAASIVDSLVMIIRAGVTSEMLVAEACAKLSNERIEGVVLNQTESHIPRWIQRLF